MTHISHRGTSWKEWGILWIFRPFSGGTEKRAHI